MTLKVFYTARELADIAKSVGLTSFANSERGVQKIALRDGWNDLPSNLCRKRSGRGGGLEYHFSLLPDLLQSLIAADDYKTAMLEAQSIQKSTDNQVLAAKPTMSLNSTQRSVMEARAQVLVAITTYQLHRGMTHGKAITAFIAAQKSYADWIEAEQLRDRGERLSVPQMTMLQSAPELTAIDGFGLLPSTILLANNRQKHKASVSRATLYDWFKLRETHGISGLAPDLTKEQAPVPVGFADFLKFYAKPSKPKASEALADYNAWAASDRKLTIDQVRHTLREKLNNIERNVGREGLLTLRSRMAYIQRTTEGMWPTTMYTADGKTFDAEIADPVSSRPMRPEITSILDVATRKCVGFAVSRKENVIAVVEALRNACVSDGIPAIFYTDRGVGYKNKTIDGTGKAEDGDVSGMLGRLGITKMHALPYNSQAKGIIERFNGTVWNPLARRFPTYIGTDMDKEAGQAIHKETRSQIVQFGHATSMPTWDAFLNACQEAIAVYNDKPHSGLLKVADPETGRMRHMSPNECWAQHVAEGFEPIEVHSDDEDDLFRPYEVRTCRRALIEWNKNQYFHIDLEAWHGRKVMVGYDLHQADRVWVREYDIDSGKPGRLICVAEFSGNKERYIPLTYQRAAEETRVKGQLRRTDIKRAGIKEQLDAPLYIDHRPVASIPEFVQPVAYEPVSIAANKSSRKVINPDVELALDVIADPSKLTEGRRRLLLDLTAGRAGREFLRVSGVDLDTLDDLLRSAA